MRQILTAMLAAALLLPATASAGPGDPPVEAVFPDDGAVLPVNPEGIETRYTCPEPYHVTSPDTFPTFGDRAEYGVHFATSPDLGSDGRLLQSNVVGISGPDQVQDNDIPIGQCRAYMLDSGAHPETTPGTYYWQAWRLCLDCPGDYETSAVRSFRLTAAGSGVRLAVKPPARAYRGFPFVVGLTSTGLDASTDVAVQVKRKGAWGTVGTAAATGRTADVAISLPGRYRAGRYPIRATARVGSETLAGGTKRLRLRKARGWSTSGRQDGKWTGKASGLPVSFRVSGGGRTIKAGRFQLTLLCPTPGMINPFTIQIADAPLSRARIAPDGSFVFADVIQGHASFVRGRIRGTSASGAADLSLGTCTGGAEFSAKRG
jgi:hypothetical protein